MNTPLPRRTNLLTSLATSLLLLVGSLTTLTWAVALVSDAFTGTGALPAPWVQLTAISGTTITKSGGTASPTALASQSLYYNNGAAVPADQYAQAVITATGGTAGSELGIGVLVRGAGTNNGYNLTWNKAASNNVFLAKHVAGTRSLLWTRTQTWSDGDTLRLEVTGTSLVAKRNTVAIGTAFTDTSLATGQPGLAYMGGAVTAGTWDNFEGGDLTTGVAPTRRPLWFNSLPWPVLPAAWRLR